MFSKLRAEDLTKMQANAAPNRVFDDRYEVQESFTTTPDLNVTLRELQCTQLVTFEPTVAEETTTEMAVYVPEVGVVFGSRSYALYY